MRTFPGNAGWGRDAGLPSRREPQTRGFPPGMDPGPREQRGEGGPRGWGERDPPAAAWGGFGADRQRFGADLSGAIPSSHQRDSGPAGPIPSPQKRSSSPPHPPDFPASARPPVLRQELIGAAWSFGDTTAINTLIPPGSPITHIKSGIFRVGWSGKGSRGSGSTSSKAA